MTWNGAGGWVIFSHDRQLNFSRTVWITFHWRGTTSKVSVTASPSDELATTVRTTRRCRHDHALARQVSRQRRSHRPLAGQAARGGIRLDRPSRDCVFRGARFQLLELEFQLVEQLAAALSRLPEPLTLHLGDQQLQIGHHRLGAGGTSLRLLTRRPLGSQCRLQRNNVGGQRFGRRHKPDYPILPGSGPPSTKG
jgi:hypothetical protein